MMQGPPGGPEPPTQFEQDLSMAYQMMSGSRMQTMMTHEVTVSCVKKCMDLNNLFTNEREEWPMKKRLATDKKEKDCVLGCSAKFQELFPRMVNRTNQRETIATQMKFMEQQQLAGGAPPGM